MPLARSSARRPRRRSCRVGARAAARSSRACRAARCRSRCTCAASPYSAASRARRLARPRPVESRGVVARCRGRCRPLSSSSRRSSRRDRDVDAPPSIVRLEAVLDRVLDDRLQQHRRHLRRRRARRATSIDHRRRAPMRSSRISRYARSSSTCPPSVAVPLRRRRRGAQQRDQPIEHPLRERGLGIDQRSRRSPACCRGSAARPALRAASARRASSPSRPRRRAPAPAPSRASARAARSRGTKISSRMPVSTSDTATIEMMERGANSHSMPLRDSGRIEKREQVAGEHAEDRNDGIVDGADPQPGLVDALARRCGRRSESRRRS